MSEPFSLVLGPRTFGDAAEGFSYLANRLETAPKAITPQVRGALIKHLQLIAMKVADLNSGSSTGDHLARRSGALTDSLRAGVRSTGTDLASLAVTIMGVDYLSIHEHGGTIHARNSKYLAIPLDAAKNADGTPKLPSPRDWGNTFVGKSKRGNLLIFQRRGRQIVPLYALKLSVNIRPRLGLRAALEDPIAAALLMESFAAMIMKEIFGGR